MVARRKRRSDREDDLSGFIVLGILAAIGWWVNNVGGLGSLLVVIVIGTVGYITFRWWLKQRREQKLAASGINDVDRMTGGEFERFIAAHFRRKGYQTKLTPKNSDYGADLVLEKDSRKVVVQAKRWDNLVGVAAIQEVLGAINYYSAGTGIVVTNSDFTENAYELAKKSPVELWNRSRLTQHLMSTGGSTAILDDERINPGSIDDLRRCPTCGNALVTRSGRRGKFWGCSSFPKCKYTADF